MTADGSVIPIESLRVKYNEVLLKMDREIAPDATVRVTYRRQSRAPLQDSWGRWPWEFTDFRVPHGPMFRRLFVEGGEGTEGVDTHIDFQVTMEPSSPDAWSIDYATVDGTAIAGDDYTATSGRLSFAPNEGSKTVSVPIIDDAVEDDGETFRLVLAMSSMRGDVRLLNNRDTVAVGKIRNTETPTTPGLSVADASATEGSAVAFAVSLSEASSQQVTVRYATAGGTATSGTDFTAGVRDADVRANETSKTVEVATTDDSDDEQNETFTLTLSSPTNATLARGTATGTINDDDDAAPPPLTAGFGGMPASHDGQSAFTFDLDFSENVPDLSYTTLRDDAFTVTGGDVTGARRRDPNGGEPNRAWEITVQPGGDADVAITLPETTDCSAPRVRSAAGTARFRRRSRRRSRDRRSHPRR